MNNRVLNIKEDEDLLRQVSDEVMQIDNSVLDTIEILDDYCSQNCVMGMSAIQLGIPKRIVYLKNTNLGIINKMQNDTATYEENNHNESKILINPVVISRHGLTEYWESCASCLSKIGLVSRPYRMLIEYIDINGIKHITQTEGFESTVLSHELDHLDGILFVDVADKIYDMSPEKRAKFRKNHGYKILSTYGNYDELFENNDKDYTLKKKY